jgi:hypothetical protein
MRGIAIGRKNDMFVGSERSGKSAAVIYPLQRLLGYFTPMQRKHTLVFL